MDAHLVGFSTIVETRVVDQIGASVVSGDDGVVSLRRFSVVAHGLIAPFAIAAQQFLAVAVAAGAVVVHRLGVGGSLSQRVFVGAVHGLRAIHAHLVSTIRLETSVGDEEVVPVADVLNIRGLARHAVASGYALAEVGVGGQSHSLAVVVAGVGVVVVAKAVVFVEAQHPDAAEPRAVCHPQQSVFIVEHAWVDGIGPVALPVGALIIACWQLRQRAQSQLHVGLFVGDAHVGGVEESREHHRSLVGVGAANVVCGEQNDARCPVVAVDAEVHAPLLHLLVPQNVGRPHVAVDVVGSGIAAPRCRPCHHVVRAEVHRLTAYGHGGRLIVHERFVVGGVVAHARHAPGSGEGRPLRQVRAAGRCPVRAEDVVLLARRFPHHRRVVHRNVGVGRFLRHGLCVAHGHLLAVVGLRGNHCNHRQRYY